MSFLRTFLAASTRVTHRLVDQIGDLQFKIETNGRIEPFELDLPDHALTSSRAYQAAPYMVLQDIFKKLKTVNVPTKHFFDIGCGKGRALIMAYRHGFQKLTGIDLSPKMVQQARMNIQRAGIASAEIHQEDAAAYAFPKEPVVYFLNNPFDAHVLRPVVQNLKEQSPKDSLVIYLNPLREHLFLQLGFQKIDAIESLNHNYTCSFFKL